MTIKSFTFAAAGAILASGCHAAHSGHALSASGDSEPAQQLVVAKVQPITHECGTASFMPKAVAYQMSGPYADNVPVQVNASGDIVSYPAPTDISDASTPIDLGDGWWLDRRGISDNSVFTRFTYKEYRAMAQAPSLAELKAAILPDARVTQIFQLPMTTGQAEADLAAAKAKLPVIRIDR